MLPAISALLLAFSMPLTSHGVAIRNPAVEPKVASQGTTSNSILGADVLPTVSPIPGTDVVPGIDVSPETDVLPGTDVLPDTEGTDVLPGTDTLPAETKPVPLANGIPLRIMPLGASITFGVESSDGNGYRNDVRKALVAGGNPVNMVGSQKGGTMKDNENESYPGLRIGQVKDLALKSLKETKPNLVLINLGTNDASQDFHVSTAKDRMAELIGLIYNRTDNTATVVLSTLLPNKNETTAKNVVIINAMYVKLVAKLRTGKKRIVLADMTGPDGPNLLTDFADDTHPNDKGYAKMAKIWLTAIREAAKEGLLQNPVKVQPDIPDDGGS